MMPWIVEAFGRDCPLVLHKPPVFRIAGRDAHARKNRRRHEERITPPPEVFGRIIRTLDQSIENRSGVGDAFSIPMLRRIGEIKIEVCLAERHVIRMRETVVEKLPLLLGCVMEYRMPIPRIASGRRGCNQSIVESSEGPLRIEVGLRNAQLPVWRPS